MSRKITATNATSGCTQAQAEHDPVANLMPKKIFNPKAIEKIKREVRTKITEINEN